MRRFIGLMLATLSMSVIADTSSPRIDTNAPAGQAVLIMDYSGSMWGRIQGQPKINIARDVVSELIQKWDNQVHLGLLMYGHRRAKDCSDIETTIPVGPVDPQQFISTLQSYQPKGRTPLSDSLIQAADKLDYKNKRASVILVSDGKETCGLNPCQVAKRLHESGADFTVHLVGYDLNEAERKSVECIANVTGGKYIDADSASELRDALQEAIQEAATLPNDNLRVVLAPGKAAVNDEQLRWEIFAEGVSTGEPLLSETGSNISPSLDPGRYTVVATLGAARGQQAIEIREDKQQTHDISLNAAYLSLNAQLDAGTDSSQVTWTVSSPLLANSMTATNGGAPILLPAGDYQLQATMGEQAAQTQTQLAAGVDGSASVDFRSATVATNTAGDVGVINWIVENASGKEVRRQTGSSASFSIPAGSYTIIADDGRAKISQTITVAAADNKSLNFVMQGALQVNAILHEGGKAVAVAWVITDEQGNSRHTANGENTRVVLPKGSYTITAIHPLNQTTQIVAVEPGRDTFAQIDLDMGYVNLSASETNAGTNALPVNWLVQAKDGKQVLSSENAPADSKATIMLPKGQYIISASNHLANVAHSVTITEANTAQQHYVLYGTVDATASTHKNGEPQAVKWELIRYSDNATQNAAGTAADFVAAPGKYLLRAIHPELTSSKEIIVSSGQHNSNNLVMGIGGVEMQAFMTKRLQNAIPVTWKVVPLDAAKDASRIATAREFSGPTLSMPLADGRYRISALHKQAYAETEVLVSAGATHNQSLALYGIVKASAFDSAANANGIDAAWRVRNISANEATGQMAGKGKTIELILPSADYELSAAAHGHQVNQSMKVTAGGELDLTANLSIGYIKATASRVLEGKTIAAEFALVDEQGNRNVVDVSKLYQQAIKAGKYTLEAADDKTLVSQAIEINAGQTTDSHLTLYGVHNFAAFKQATTGVDVEWTLFRSGNGEAYATSRGTEASFELPAGEYQYTAKHPAQSQEGTFIVAAGKNQQHDVAMNIGDISLQAFKTSRKSTPLDVEWSVQNVSSNRVFTASGSTATLTVPAGKYMVSASDSVTAESSETVVNAEATTSVEAMLYGIRTVASYKTATASEQQTPVTWSVFGAGGSKPIASDTGANAEFLLPSGEYSLIASHPAQTLTVAMNVKAGDNNHHDVGMNIGSLSLTAIKTERGEPLPVAWSTLPVLTGKETSQGNRSQTAQGSNTELVLPAGEYDVIANDGVTSEQTKVTITGGQMTTATLPMYAILQLAAFDKVDGKATKVNWSLSRGETNVATFDATAKELIVPTGSYQVAAFHPANTKAEDIALKAGTTTALPVNLDIGYLDITALESNQLPPKPLQVNWTITGSDSLNPQVHTASKATNTLAAGTYSVSAEHNGVVEKLDFTIAAGQTTTAPLFIYGIVTAEAFAEAGKNAEHVEWKVLTIDSKGYPQDTVYNEINDQPRFVLPRGDYQLRAKHDQLNATAKLSVVPGKSQHKTMSYNYGQLVANAWSGPSVPADVSWTLTPAEGDASYPVSITHRQLWTLEPGDYTLTAKHDGAEQAIGVTIKAGQRNEQDIYLNIARINLDAEEALGRDTHARWQVIELIDNNLLGKTVFTGITNKASIEVPAGNYRITATQAIMDFSKNVTLNAGTESTITATVNSGYVSLKAVDASQSKAVNVEWLVYDDGVLEQAPVASHISNVLEMPLAEGNYTVQLRYQGYAQQKIKLSIKAGQRHENTVFVWDAK